MRLHASQLVSFTTVGLFFAGVLVAGHYDAQKRAQPQTAGRWTAPPGGPLAYVRDELAPSPRPPAPPMTLTASDGTGLALAKLEARAVVSDPLAFTELHLVFQNPNDRVIEGNFSVTLPPGATVSRFAMKLGDTWQEGEMVEKQAARRAYEDFLHRRQDPALLEQGAGNAFAARVFPIPARGTKELIIAYTQELTGHASYALPLRGLPEIGQVDVAVSLSGDPAPVKVLKQAKLVPSEDFVLDPSFIRPTQGLRSRNLVLARIAPMPTDTPDPVGSAIILFDTSASRALGFDDQIELLGKLARELGARSGPDAQLTVACFDQTTEPIFSGKVSAFGETELGKIRERRALGASNLEQALAWAKTQARTTGTKRVIVVTDGVPTAGETEADKLGAVAAALKEAGVERLDAITVGGIRDDAMLHRLATAGLARDGVVVDGRLVVNAIARRLNGATRSGIPVKVEGATFSYPTTLDGVQAGDEFFVYADVPESLPVRVSVGGAPIGLDLQHVERPLLERAWVQAKIGSVLARERLDGPKPETKQEIVDLSLRYRVMSPYTSLLVLETDADYARFDIDRNKLADILVVDGGRLALKKRTELAELETGAKGAEDKRETGSAAEPPPFQGSPGQMWADEIGDSFGAGGLGLSGVGEGGGGQGDATSFGMIGALGHGAGTGTGQGFGAGYGGLGGAHQTRSPVVRQGPITVTGPGQLPPEVIQRAVRQNFGRFRACYENGLRNNPTLAGSVATRFIILKDGSVGAVTAGGYDLPDAAVASCVRRAFQGLSFPAPQNGTVEVVFPWIFAPGGSTRTGDDPHPPLDAPKAADPYTGKFKTVMDALGKHADKEALDTALGWVRETPGDVMALVALGEAYEAAKDLPHAERAYGSIIDLFSSRADLRRFAGERLDRIHDAPALDLAVDTFAKAALERPDHPSSHRLLAFAWLKKGDHAKAFEAGVAGVKQVYPEGRFAGVDRILREDLGLLAAAWIKAEPARRDEILKKLADAGGTVEDGPSIRFVLNWETDANDVDFHIYDDRGGHAYYAAKSLPSGGDLYADVTTGYGPECFTIRGPKAQRAGLYTLQANYFSRGPMGYGMGKLEIIEHDGKGGLTFDERSFVVMVDHAFVDLGTVKR